MKRIVIILTLFLICSSCPAIMVESELDANNIQDSEFNITAEKKGQLIVFRVNWSKDAEHANNTLAILQVNDGNDTLVLTEISKSSLSREKYRFKVNLNLLKNSKFTISVSHPTMPSGSIYWFNLKNMYDGLMSIKEDKGSENGK